MILLVIFVNYLSVFSQENGLPGAGGPQNDSITFTYKILEPKADETDFVVIKDSVFFKIFYVDFACSEYVYEFQKEGIIFIIRRITNTENACTKETDQIYAFEGLLANVPKGKYQIQLENQYLNKKTVLFREVVQVK